MFYQEYGDKNAPSLLLFIHGGGVSGWMWEKQIQHFKDYHCIVPNLPEHGMGNGDTQFSIKTSAEKLLTLIEQKVNGKKVIVIGFSLGSQIIIQMLSMKPKLMDMAIINSALTRPMPFTMKMIRPTIKLTYPLNQKRWFAKLQAKTLFIGDDYFDQYFEESLQIKYPALVRVLEENMSFAIPDGFRNAEAKILVTVGGKEKAMMNKSAMDIVEANSNCVGVVIREAGHGIPLAMPDLFNEMVDAWIQNRKLPTECEEL